MPNTEEKEHTLFWNTHALNLILKHITDICMAIQDSLGCQHNNPDISYPLQKGCSTD